MNSLQEYGDLFERLNLTELTVEEDSKKITLKREASCVTTVASPLNVMTPAAAPAPVAAEEKQAAANAPVSEEPAGDPVKAPLLGVFYATLVEGAPLSTGAKIKKGDVLCTIEAMKMMNEVRAPRDGVITKVCVEDGALVEYNQVLFWLE